MSIIIKSEIWTICYCLGLNHWTMVCTACLSIFLILCNTRTAPPKSSLYTVNVKSIDCKWAQLFRRRSSHRWSYACTDYVWTRHFKLFGKISTTSLEQLTHPNFLSLWMNILSNDISTFSNARLLGLSRMEFYWVSLGKSLHITPNKLFVIAVVKGTLSDHKRKISTSSNFVQTE